MVIFEEHAVFVECQQQNGISIKSVLASHMMVITIELYVKLGMEIDHEHIYECMKYYLQISIHGYGNGVKIWGYLL